MFNIRRSICVILICITFRLSDIAKKIFYELGSSLIHDIKFRSSWYFVGQKGIDSFTPFEDMFAPSSNEWAKPIDLAVCVPLNCNCCLVFTITFCFSYSMLAFSE